MDDAGVWEAKGPYGLILKLEGFWKQVEQFGTWTMRLTL